MKEYEIGKAVETPIVRECPVCGAMLNGATEIGGPGAQPIPDDITVCFYCAAGLVFTDTGFRVMTDKERIDIETESKSFAEARRKVLIEKLIRR